MNDTIKEKLKLLPLKSGVYVMRDSEGDVIYVGKAKILKNRVSQYFHNSQKPKKVQQMVENVHDFDYFITNSEMDALLLENNLIKKYQPFYNILLKDDKQFPYIRIDLKQAFPRLEIVRKVKKDGAKYFGPYLAGIDVRMLVKAACEAFGLRTCTLNITPTSVAARPCLNHDLGLCSAPCIKNVDQQQYRAAVERAINFLKGNDEEIEEILQQKMQNAANCEDFENAIRYREQLGMVKKLKSKLVASLTKDVDKDVFAYVTDGQNGVVTNMVVRGGKILGVVNYPCHDAEINEEETLFNFLWQYYQTALCPNEVVLSHNIQEKEVFEQFFGKKINFVTLPHGINKTLLDMARENATDFLSKHIEKQRLRYGATFGAMQALKDKIELSRLPRRIECYDVSNIGGSFKVCSMVVFVDGDIARQQYRKFKIKTVAGANDFLCLKEALTRRLTRLAQGDSDQSFSKKPDLLLIDGGKGQLGAVRDVLEELGFADIDLRSIAKKQELIFAPQRENPYVLKVGSAELRLLQRVRDEAHRFAITYHRKLRTQAQTKSPLDQIRGIGQKKKSALLAAFGTTEQIAIASPQELAKVEGIDIGLANRILKTLRGDV